MRCPSCGMESEESSVFCTYCGVKLQPELKVENLRIEPELKELRDAVSTRRRTDRRIPPWVVVVPFIVNMIFSLILVGALFSRIFDYAQTEGEVPSTEVIFADMNGYIVAALAFNAMFYAVYAVIAYAMIDRANKHLDRERAVMAAVAKVLGKLGAPASRRSTWDTWDAPTGPTAYGAKRSPLFWALVVILPLMAALPQDYAVLVGDFDLSGSLQYISYPVILVHAVLLFYMLHMVTDDTWKHDQAWTDFARSTKVSIARAGGTAGGLDEGFAMQKRPTVLFIVLAIVTFGLLLIYWWYVAVKDPNQHYNKQARFEDQLIDLLSGRS